jgi:hypothetical protein
MAGHLRKCDPASIYLELDSSVLVALSAGSTLTLSRSMLEGGIPGCKAKARACALLSWAGGCRAAQ